MKSIFTGIKTIIRIENWQEYFRWLLFLPPKDDFIKLRNGIKYKIRKHDTDKWVVEEVCVRDLYNPKGFEIGESDVVIDIGAHIGVFSVLAASQAKKGRVISFEPFRESYDVLNENLLLNNITNAKAVNLGVSGKREKRRIYFDENNSCCNSAYLKHAKFTEMECTTLEDIFRDYSIGRCDYLKIDCEGSEFDILFNTPDEIFGRIDKIAFECHDTFVKEYSRVDMQRFLEKKGFEVVFRPPLMMYAVRKQKADGRQIAGVA